VVVQAKSANLHLPVHPDIISATVAIQSHRRPSHWAKGILLVGARAFLRRVVKAQCGGLWQPDEWRHNTGEGFLARDRAHLQLSDGYPSGATRFEFRGALKPIVSSALESLLAPMTTLTAHCLLPLSKRLESY
jgi:hypothetical protein